MIATGARPAIALLVVVVATSSTSWAQHPQPAATEHQQVAPQGPDSGSDAADYRPSLAILPLTVAGAEDAAPAQEEEARGKRLESGLVRSATRSGVFSRVLGPEMVRALVGDRGATASCCDATCLVPVSTALHVERIVCGQLQFSEVGPALRLLASHGAPGSPVEVRVEAPDDDEDVLAFEKSVAARWLPLLSQISSPLAQLSVKPSSPGAIVLLDDLPLSLGPVQRLVAPGRHRLRVVENGFDPFDQDVELEPGRTLQVDATLRVAAVPASPPLEVPRPRAAPALWQRPGVYLAGAGLAALGAAGALLATGDGATSFPGAASRREAATTVLLSAGTAALTGGVVWLALEAPGSHDMDEPSDPTGIAVLMIGARGEF